MLFSYHFIIFNFLDSLVRVTDESYNKKIIKLLSLGKVREKRIFVRLLSLGKVREKKKFCQEKMEILIREIREKMEFLIREIREK